MSSTNWTTFCGGGEVKYDTTIEIKKLHNIAIDPNPSGEIPNHHSEEGGRGPNHPNLNLAM